MRDYDPATGRYLQADPLGLVDGASVYGYARGNPGRWVDPRGEQTAEATGPLLAIAAACAAGDGPLPIGDLIALGILAYAALAPSETCGCEDTCPSEMPLSQLDWMSDSYVRQLGLDPHDLKQDDGGLDLYRHRKSGCIYTGPAKNSRGGRAPDAIGTWTGLRT